MRNYLDLFDNILTEGVGLANRKPGDTFKNPQGDVIFFKSLTFYPEVGQFQNYFDLEAAEKQLGINVQWINQPKSGTKPTAAFAVAMFATEDGQEYYLGKYFTDIKANRRDNTFAHNEIPGGFKYASGRGASENAGYKPSQVLKDFAEQTPFSVAKQIIEKFGESSSEAQAVKIFLAANDFPVVIPAGTMNFNAFSVYFCEMLQPIAFIKGMTLKGNAQECVDTYLGSMEELRGCTISFNSGTGGLLADSVLTSGTGKSINISTKDASGGAKASAQNLKIEFNKLRESPSGRKLLEKNESELSIINAFGKDSHYSAPLTIAVQAGLITQEESNQVMMLKDGKFGLGFDPVGQRILSSKLEGWYTDYLSNWKKQVVPIHTLMLIIGSKVCNYVNTKTNFSSAASEILNNGALLQVSTQIKQQGENFVFEGLNCTYPGKAVTGVQLTTEKAYWTTGAQGNMTFKILFNNAKAKKEDPLAMGDGSDSATVTAQKVDKKIDDITGGASSVNNQLRPTGAEPTARQRRTGAAGAERERR
jgi:hypothetical protein